MWKSHGSEAQRDEPRCKHSLDKDQNQTALNKIWYWIYRKWIKHACTLNKSNKMQTTYVLSHCSSVSLLINFLLPSNLSFSFAGPYERQKDRNLAFETYVTKEQLPGLPIMFRCTLCGKSMAQKRNALNHVENIHFPGSFIHQCSSCGKELKSKEALNNHVRTHKDVWWDKDQN